MELVQVDTMIGRKFGYWLSGMSPARISDLLEQVSALQQENVMLQETLQEARTENVFLAEQVRTWSQRYVDQHWDDIEPWAQIIIERYRGAAENG